MLFNLSDQNSIANQFLRELRDQEIQKDRRRFRSNLTRLGEILAYEISKTLVYKNAQIRTSLGLANVNIPREEPVLLCILRAGIPFLQGFQNYFDQADCGFIGAYRNESRTAITINMDYFATPDTTGKTLIITDPMLATGESLVAAIQSIMKRGKPNKINIASVIAAPEGVARVSSFMAESDVMFSIWTAAVDESLNEHFYIVPGLGDAGDLSYGAKTV